MMEKRAIHLFPCLSNASLIEKWREVYDPLYGLIPPHITLCFPFESQLSTKDLMRHIQGELCSFSPFNLKLQGMSSDAHEYLFLNIIQGDLEIRELHRRLYSGLLNEYLNQDRPYVPHLTLGRFTSPEGLQKALDEVSQSPIVFEAEINSVVVENIQFDESSVMEYIYYFKTDIK